jgi:hypothetical protein
MYGYLIIAAKHDLFNKLNLKGPEITKVIDEELFNSAYAKKRNILRPNEAFKTQAAVGNISHIVQQIKVC